MKGYLLLVNSVWALQVDQQAESKKFDFFNFAEIGSKLQLMSLHKHGTTRTQNERKIEDQMLLQTDKDLMLGRLPELSKDEMDDALADAFGNKD